MNVKFTIATIATIALLASGSVANSVTVNFVSGTIAGDVTDVIVGGNFYDVDFVGNISATDWLSQLDFTTEADALAAADALNTALNSAGATAVSLEQSDGTINDGVVFFRTSSGDDGTSLLGARNLFLSGSWSTALSSFTLGTAFPFAADWTLTGPVAVVPIPAALPLFGTGLAIMGFIGWRRKRKVAVAA